MNIKLGAGAKRTPIDYRQINLSHIVGPAPVPAPTTSIHIDFSKVPDMFQREIGACTCHAFAEIYTHRQQRLAPSTAYVASPRFLYTTCRMDDGNGVAAGDIGTFCVQPFKEAVKWGVASQATVVNDTTLPYLAYVYEGIAANVPQAAFTEADKFRIPGYVQVGAHDNVTEANIIQALQMPDGADGITICLPVGAEWYTTPAGVDSWKMADIIPIRKVVTAIDGHQVACIGIDQEAATGRWKVYFRNHWSLNWASTSGIEGGTQPADINGDIGWLYLDQHTLTEAWMISEIPDALLAIVKSLPAQADFSHLWSVDLKPGATGPDVQALQIALKITGDFPFLQPVTTYFGPITVAAVQSFQKHYNVANAATIAAAGGEIGPATRGVLNKMFSHQ
jgi:hypothetical protein